MQLISGETRKYANQIKGEERNIKSTGDVMEGFLGSESDSVNEDSHIELVQTDILCDWDDWFDNS